MSIVDNEPLSAHNEDVLLCINTRMAQGEFFERIDDQLAAVRAVVSEEMIDGVKLGVRLILGAIQDGEYQVVTKTGLPINPSHTETSFDLVNYWDSYVNNVNT